MKTKMKTSLTLSREVVRGIDRVAGKKRSRSAVVDDVLRGYLSQRERAAANARDVEKINRFADEQPFLKQVARIRPSKQVRAMSASQAAEKRTNAGILSASLSF
jgi:hypothetical protein